MSKNALLRLALSAVLAAVPTLIGPRAAPGHAQASVQARVIPQMLNVRQEPRPDAPIVGQVTQGTVLAVSGRETNPDDGGIWVYAEPVDGGPQGWVNSEYLAFAPDFNYKVLPVLSGPTPAADPISVADSAPATLPDLPAGVVPTVDPALRVVVMRGRALGNRSDAFSKVGDSITYAPEFLFPIGWGRFQLRSYTSLGPVVQHFAASFARPSLAARAGWTSLDLLNPLVADPTQCQPGESPLTCEYRVHRPAAALIMIGTNDIAQEVDAATYRANLDLITRISLEMGVVPVLSTLPDILVMPEMGAQVLVFNQIVAEVAAAHGVPLWDYWRAMQALPHKGLGADSYHPSSAGRSPDESAIFSADNLRYGYTIRNLTALMALDAVWRAVLY